MVFCPFYNKECVRSTDCAIWNVESNSCGFNKTTSLLKTISQSSVSSSAVSVPPTGCFKVTNYYVNAEGKFVLEYDDIPA
jgi:hypothetical protein